ncbi:sulfatase-like hydrolase/transferase [Novipirellula artificiosorum]|uniref:Arylsulfatase n=1 Tax=Novipirellula artificiosorum TaxID=2528016 RepID=A0A5C6DU15_9BACT|nr:sulfatase-like hydrolase/transferase [Novipirellula artificiosorum]TWU38536.1 Arylsulfatase [Novipirellula artificiosorum]
MKNVGTFAGVAVALLAITPVVAADPPQSTAQSSFTKADKNGDGKLGPDEVKNQTLFKRMDTDFDGFVSQKEAQAHAKRRGTRAGAAVAAGEEVSNIPVFPANADGEAAKRELLSTIADVTSGPKRPPNIVLLFSDDLGYGDISLYGSEEIPTPNIDALGKQGVRFSNAYVTAASCSPSRAGLMSGRYQQRFGFEFNTAGGAITHRLHRGLDPSVVTLTDVLKQAGYVTGMFGKWHLGTQPQFHPQARGFDEFYGFLAGAHSFFPAKAPQPFHSTIMRDKSPLIEPEYLTDAIARETVRFIDANQDKPFFAYVPFNAVHTPIEATKKYQDRFPDESDQTQRDYYAMTSALDDAVGSIVAAIDKHGLSENTLVIFVNDNGGPIYTGVQSNGPLKLGKLFLFEGGIRVPMVIKLPGRFEPNTVYDQPTSTLDLFPTICAAAGIKVPAGINLDGVDLTPFINRQSTGTPHETLFWSNGPNIAVRQGKWKLVKSYDNTWLFDLAADIGESKNLADSRPEIVEQLEQAYQDWRSGMSKPAWPSKPNRRKVEVDGLVYEMNI